MAAATEFAQFTVPDNVEVEQGGLDMAQNRQLLTSMHRELHSRNRKLIGGPAGSFFGQIAVENRLPVEGRRNWQ